MKKTDVIVPINPYYKKDYLQLIIVNSKSRGTEVIPIEDPNPKFIIVPVEADEWVKVSIDERDTLKVDPTVSNCPSSTFKYICYTLTAEKTSSDVDSNCYYLINKCNQLNLQEKKRSKKKAIV